MSSILSTVEADDSGHLNFLKIGLRLFLYVFNVCGLGHLGSKSRSVGFIGFLLLPSDAMDNALLLSYLFLGLLFFLSYDYVFQGCLLLVVRFRC